MSLYTASASRHARAALETKDRGREEVIVTACAIDWEDDEAIPSGEPLRLVGDGSVGVCTFDR